MEHPARLHNWTFVQWRASTNRVSVNAMLPFADGTASLVVFLLALYGVPSIVAFTRTHHQRFAILTLNLLLGWTLIGWVGALVWSATAIHDPAPPPQH